MRRVLACLEASRRGISLGEQSCSVDWVSDRRPHIVRFGYASRVTHPLAACSPRPLLPPVTTATLPSRLNIVLKSFSCTSIWADMANHEMEDLWYGSRNVSSVMLDQEAIQRSNGSRSWGPERKSPQLKVSRGRQQLKMMNRFRLVTSESPIGNAEMPRLQGVGTWIFSSWQARINSCHSRYIFPDVYLAEVAHT